MADALLWVMKSNLKPIYGPERKVNPVARRCADTTKAAELLGFEPASALRKACSGSLIGGG